MNDVDFAALRVPSAEVDITLVSGWLKNFERALISSDVEAITALFDSESHWRDLVAFTWHITPFAGDLAIANGLISAQPNIRAHDFALDTNRAAPRQVTRLGYEVIECFFRFETELGRGNGVLRLYAKDPTKAWVMLTTLEELKGHEEKTGDRRPTGDAYSRNFGGENWLDQRVRHQRYDNNEPTVLVVGGGQAGLGIAARLGQLDIDTLVVDKLPRIGDCWRLRYHSLALHNEIYANHLPYLPFPPTMPKYIPKDMLANWFEFYAGVMEINFWTGTEFIRGDYDVARKHWNAAVRRPDGNETTLHPRHIVFANGVSGIPKIPELPGLNEFEGEIIHSHSFTDGSAWKDKKALVLGTGNSGHDVAQDLHSHGADTTIIQRGSSTVVSIDPSAILNYAMYKEGPQLEDCDLLASSATYPHIVLGYQIAVKRMMELDKDLIAGLERVGFKLDIGHDGTGHQMKYRRRGGGYYLDAGCSGLITDGEIGLLQFDKIDRFTSAGAYLKDGTTVTADLLILATGYYAQQELVRRLLGDNIAETVGEIWGIDEEDGEMRNMWKRTAQKGLWFIAGSLAQCRIYSKYLALQIKACELGLIEPYR